MPSFRPYPELAAGGEGSVEITPDAARPVTADAERPITADAERPIITAMERAIELSARGLGTTSPNPVVGCVVLDVDGNPVGEGWHEVAGGPHAEVNALAAA